MRQTMRIFLSEAAYEAAIRSKVEGLLQTAIGERIRLYSENPAFLRKATAAHQSVSVRVIKPDSILLPAMARAIRAFGDELATANLRPHPVPGTIGEVLANLRDAEDGLEPFPKSLMGAGT